MWPSLLLWYYALVWSKCPAPDQNKAAAEKHASLGARGTLRRLCCASLTERWHRLCWLPAAKARTNSCFIFFFLWFLECNSWWYNIKFCFSAFTHSLWVRQLVIVCRSGWSLSWMSNTSDYEPNFCFTWSVHRYTHCFVECFLQGWLAFHVETKKARCWESNIFTYLCSHRAKFVVPLAN